MEKLEVIAIVENNLKIETPHKIIDACGKHLFYSFFKAARENGYDNITQENVYIEILEDVSISLIVNKDKLGIEQKSNIMPIAMRLTYDEKEIGAKTIEILLNTWKRFLGYLKENTFSSKNNDIFSLNNNDNINNSREKFIELIKVLNVLNISFNKNSYKVLLYDKDGNMVNFNDIKKTYLINTIIKNIKNGESVIIQFVDDFNTPNVNAIDIHCDFLKDFSIKIHNCITLDISTTTNINLNIDFKLNN